MALNFHFIFDNISTPVLVAKPIFKDGQPADFEISFLNNEMKRIAGYFIKEAAKWSDISEDAVSDIPWFILACEAVEGIPRDTNKFQSSVDKNWYKIDMNYVPDEQYLIVTFANITSELSYSQKLEESFVTDKLTGFQNREGFLAQFGTAIEAAKKTDTAMALLILDIDNLKNINDSLGTKYGDEVIQKAATLLRRFQRENLRVFRYGDDEFAVIISALDSADYASTFTDAIFEAFQMAEIEVSGGISVFPENSTMQDELIRFADMAIHDAKKNGKNIFVNFEPTMQREFIHRMTLQSKMTTAILESSFRLFFQPQFDINSGQLRGFEALIRWHDDELGDISPSVFIPIAEETGLIIPIGRWVLNTAFSTLRKWQDDYDFKGVISVNVSPIQMQQEGFIDELRGLINKYKINPEYLEVEITEGVMIKNMHSTIEKLHSINDMGLKVSLDDFGTGYSSLSYLQQLPLHTLKIDKSFINDITSENGIQANITSSIIKMVENMGLETIAEGVEYPEQLAMLAKFKCNIVQGFLRGKPMSSDLCESYLGGDTSALLKNNN